MSTHRGGLQSCREQGSPHLHVHKGHRQRSEHVQKSRVEADGRLRQRCQRLLVHHARHAARQQQRLRRVVGEERLLLRAASRQPQRVATFAQAQRVDELEAEVLMPQLGGLRARAQPTAEQRARRVHVLPLLHFPAGRVHPQRGRAAVQLQCLRQRAVQPLRRARGLACAMIAGARVAVRRPRTVLMVVGGGGDSRRTHVAC